ncbi:hypothetical protein FOA52_003355 [Chlamydomonas sp. UWO 241]|nr:hypothetical protein FOA52_003355 [Chlamydomonas sp. UWO 241]
MQAPNTQPQPSHAGPSPSAGLLGMLPGGDAAAAQFVLRVASPPAPAAGAVGGAALIGRSGLDTAKPSTSAFSAASTRLPAPLGSPGGDSAAAKLVRRVTMQLTPTPAPAAPGDGGPAAPAMLPQPLHFSRVSCPPATLASASAPEPLPQMGASSACTLPPPLPRAPAPPPPVAGLPESPSVPRIVTGRSLGSFASISLRIGQTQPRPRSSLDTAKPSPSTFSAASTQLPAPSGSPVRGSSPPSAAATAAAAAAAVAAVAVPASAPELPLVWNQEQRLLVLTLVLKAADVGHLTSSPDVHRKWVARLEEEMFQQGDQERALGLSISPLMDRHGGGIQKSQTFFFNLVGRPMYQTLSSVLPAAEPMLGHLEANYQGWAEAEARAAKAAAGPRA